MTDNSLALNDGHQALINKFYSAFQQRDYATMNACYDDNILFEDPVFGKLLGNEAKAMWHMLCERGKDLQISFNNVQANDLVGEAHWEAVYTFSTERKVHNVIDAVFQFNDGKITAHQDTFDLWKWTRMALGPSGILMGWTPMVQNKVRETAKKGLEKFIAEHPEYQ